MMPSTAVSKGTKIYMYWYINPLMLINVYGISVFSRADYIYIHPGTQRHGLFASALNIEEELQKPCSVVHKEMLCLLQH